MESDTEPTPEHSPFHCPCWLKEEGSCCFCAGRPFAASGLAMWCPGGVGPCHTQLVKLEAVVEKACRAIYRDYESYWPSDAERARIATALLSTLDAVEEETWRRIREQS